MSSPLYASSPSSGTAEARFGSSSFGGPRLDLVLRPSYALGPFRLGLSLWHVLDYLRSNQSLFPQINITYDEAAPRISPIAIVIQPNLHLIFNGLTQRLVMITLENLEPSASGTAQTHAGSSSASAEPSHRPVNLIYDGRLIYSKGSARVAPVTLNRSTLHQILGPTYPGRPETSAISPNSLVSSAFRSRTDGKDIEQSEFIITYPGLAFCFAIQTKASREADVDKLQPVASMHLYSGTSPNHPEDVLASPSVTPTPSEPVRPSSRTNKGMLSPTLADSDYRQLNSDRDRTALDTDAIQTRCPALLEADITPGRGVNLRFAKSGASRASSPQPDCHTSPNGHASHIVELLLGVTTPQDALCDLGQPQRIFYKEDDRMRIHNSAAAQSGERGTRDRGSENGSSTDDSVSGSHDQDDSAFFYNYFDLGIDLLFSRNPRRMPSIGEMYDAAAHGQPRLEKVVCHTNVPGDALFQRYNRCPWRISAAKNASKLKASESNAASFSFKDHFDSTLIAGQDDRGMELDRGTCAEFKGSGGRGGVGRRQAVSKQDGSPDRDNSSEVLIDLSTRLVGREGMVLEVGKDGSMVGVVVF